jgi:hypothetical protein
MTTLDSITLNVNGAPLVLTLETARELYAKQWQAAGESPCGVWLVAFRLALDTPRCRDPCRNTGA